MSAEEKAKQRIFDAISVGDKFKSRHNDEVHTITYKGKVRIASGMDIDMITLDCGDSYSIYGMFHFDSKYEKIQETFEEIVNAVKRLAKEKGIEIVELKEGGMTYKEMETKIKRFLRSPCNVSGIDGKMAWYEFMKQILSDILTGELYVKRIAGFSGWEFGMKEDLEMVSNLAKNKPYEVINMVLGYLFDVLVKEILEEV